jgi:hypothetical protein
MSQASLLFRIRVLVAFFIAALAISGLTAFPLVWEVTWLHRWLGPGTWIALVWPALAAWIDTVYAGLTTADVAYPFLFYGTDWLAFAHIVIAIAFVGPLRDPVRNIWVIEFGMIACVLVLPLALIFGPLRGIPMFWRVLDCAFGVVGIAPLWLTRQYILQLEREGQQVAATQATTAL